MRKKRYSLLVCTVAAFAGAATPLLAQTGSSNASGSLAVESSTGGLQTSFTQNAVLGQSSHVDVTDQTQSDLRATSMAAEANSFAEGVSVSPMGPSAGGRAASSQASARGGISGFGNSSFGPTEARNEDGFGRAAGGSAFSSTMAGASHSLKVPGSGSSAGGAQSAVSLGSQPTESGASTGYAEAAVSFAGADVDPVLQPVSGASTENTLGPPILIAASPLADAESFFPEPDSQEKQYQFEDGMTALSYQPHVPGRMISAPVSYLAPTNGFPDSTMGRAALPSETAASSLSGSTPGSTSSPFPPVSAGTVFGVKTGIHPDLFAHVAGRISASRTAQQDRLFEMNIINGMSVSDAEAKRDAAMAASRGRFGRKRHGRSTASQSPSDSSISDSVSSTTIR